VFCGYGFGHEHWWISACLCWDRITHGGHVGGGDHEDDKSCHSHHLRSLLQFLGELHDGVQSVIGNVIPDKIDSPSKQDNSQP
jgi:hypothetical protein